MGNAVSLPTLSVYLTLHEKGCNFFHLHPPNGGGYCHCQKSPYLVILRALDATKIGIKALI